MTHKVKSTREMKGESKSPPDAEGIPNPGSRYIPKHHSAQIGCPNLRAAFHPRVCVVVFLELLSRNLLYEE
jgi:hypothetical protein